MYLIPSQFPQYWCSWFFGMWALLFCSPMRDKGKDGHFGMWALVYSCKSDIWSKASAPAVPSPHSAPPPIWEAETQPDAPRRFWVFCDGGEDQVRNLYWVYIYIFTTSYIYIYVLLLLNYLAWLTLRILGSLIPVYTLYLVYWLCILPLWRLNSQRPFNVVFLLRTVGWGCAERVIWSPFKNLQKIYVS